MLRAVFFDLDGTLLPMDQDVFVERYLSLLAKRFVPLGFDPKVFIDTIWKGISAEVRNDGSRTNWEVFWDVFASVFGEKTEGAASVFDDFYRNEFNDVRDFCGFSPVSDETVKMLRARGCKVVLATNPIFPEVATDNRIRWAGLDKGDFDICTVMENCGLSKPNLEYYRCLLGKIGIPAEDCLMVGNDVDEDMVASELGMKVFLVTDNFINREGKDISVYPQGNLDDMKKYIENLLCQ